MNTHIETGLHELDAHLGGGLKRGAVTVLSSHTSVGKSWFAQHIANNAARADLHVLYVTYEGHARDVWLRLLAIETGIENCRVRVKSEWSAEETTRVYATSTDLAKRSLTIVQGVRLSFNTLESAIKDIRPDLLVIDYVQLILDNDGHRLCDLVKFSADVKAITAALNCATLLVSQRDNVQPRADTILILERDNANNLDGLEAKRADLYVMGNGPLAHVSFDFDVSNGRWQGAEVTR